VSRENEILKEGYYLEEFGRYQIFEEKDKLCVYLSENLEGPKHYSVLLNVLRNPTREEIHIYINNGGGQLDTLFALVDAIQGSVSVVTAHIDHACFSAASMLMLVCDQWRIGEYAVVMIHSHYTGFEGKSHELEKEISFTQPWLKEKITKIYQGFLTQKEIKEMFKGVDFYFNSKETLKRLNNLAKQRAKTQ
jgi:ATP-dependent protease ClpP protease subunit